jgi:hypothetical protein
MATEGETELWGRRRKGAGLQHITVLIIGNVANILKFGISHV